MELWVIAIVVITVPIYLLWRSRRGTSSEHDWAATAGRPDDLRDKNPGQTALTHRKEGPGNAAVPPSLPGGGFGGGSSGT